VCAGDSLTRAQVSADYVAMLRERLPDATIVNAGVNYDLSSGLLRRLDQIVAEDPDVVTVLIGTNDVRSVLSETDARQLRRRWKLTEPPTADGFRQNLSAIVTTLRQRTRARLALLSLPVIGEDLDSAPMRRVAEYSGILRAVAAEHDVAYLALYERMVAFLAEQGTAPGTRHRPGVLLAASAATQHFVLRRSFDAISRSRGLQLTTDTIHLNTRGAGMIAEFIADFAAGRSTTSIER
jgi:lysophospholipase L1-like esterase